VEATQMFLSCLSDSTFEILIHASNILRAWFRRERRYPLLTRLLVPHFFLSNFCTHWQSLVEVDSVKFPEQEVLAVHEHVSQTAAGQQCLCFLFISVKDQQPLIRLIRTHRAWGLL